MTGRYTSAYHICTVIRWKDVDWVNAFLSREQNLKTGWLINKGYVLSYPNARCIMEWIRWCRNALLRALSIHQLPSDLYVKLDARGWRRQISLSISAAFKSLSLCTRGRCGFFFLVGFFWSLKIARVNAKHYESKALRFYPLKWPSFTFVLHLCLKSN